MPIPIRRQLRRALPLITLIMLIAAPISGWLVAPAEAQFGSTSVSFEVVDFFLEKNGKRMTFVDHSANVDWVVRVKASGIAVTGVSVPVVVREESDLSVVNRCYSLTFSSTEVGNGAVKTVRNSMEIPRLDEGDSPQHNLVAYVNVGKDDARFGSAQPDADTGGCPTPYKRADGTQPEATKTTKFVIDRRLNLRVTEIQLCRNQPNPDPCSLNDDGKPYNRTVYQGLGGTANWRPVHFRVRVQNDDQANWTTTYDPNDCPDPSDAATCHGFPFRWKIEVENLQNGTRTVVENRTVDWNDKVSGSGGYTDGLYSTAASWNIFGLAGLFKVHVDIDLDGEIPETNEVDNAYNSTLTLEYADLVSRIDRTGLKLLDGNETYDYDADGNVEIPFSWSFENVGTQPAQNGQRTPYSYWVYLDEITEDKLLTTGELASSLAPGANKTGLSYTLKGSKAEIPPGPHKLIVVADWPASVDCSGQHSFCEDRGVLWERYETENNLDEVEFLIHDDRGPNVTGLRATCADHLSYNDCTADTPTVRVGQYVNLTVTASDTDRNLTAWLNLTHPSLGSIEVNLTRHPGNRERYYHNFTSGILYNGTLAFGNLTVRAWARDTAGNPGNSTELVLNVTRWPIQELAPDAIVTYPANASSEPYQLEDETGEVGEGQVPLNNFALVVRASDTGVRPENTTSNKKWRMTYPDGTVEEGRFASDQVCAVSLADNVGCPGGQYTFTEKFSHLFPRDQAGEHFVEVMIRDAAGMTRFVNVTYLLIDELPEITNFNIPDAVDAGGNFTTRVNVNDDFRVEEVWLNFTRVGANYNLSVPMTFVENVGNDNRQSGVYEADVTTGAFANLSWGGSYKVKVVARDAANNWNSSALKDFQVHDTRSPTIIPGSARVSPSVQELGEDVQFEIRATDDTALQVHLTISRGNEIVEDRSLDDPDQDSKYVFKRAFDTAGAYTVIIDVKDSVNRTAGEPFKQNFEIVKNLPPRFLVKQPSIRDPATGQHFASARPTISVLVYDTDDVRKESIRMSLGGIELTSVDMTRSEDPPGWLVTYETPVSQAPYRHRETINVSLVATDASDKNLTATEDPLFTFMVDASPPKTRLTEIKPNHRANENDVLNVSLDSLFTLTADDNDNVPTGVKQLNYRISGAQAGSEIVYNAPFRLRDAPTNVYRGPSTYTVTFWAEDQVGNVEPHLGSGNVITVFVDDSPPDLDAYRASPRPCDGFGPCTISAAFIDGRTGVARGIVWYRIDSGPYTPLEMTKDADGIWNAELPQGKKNQQLSYYMEAWDFVENKAQFGSPAEPYASFKMGNHQPTLRITSPENGATVKGNVLVKWTATDEDGDELRVKVSYRLAGKVNYVELQTVTGGRSEYAWDTTALADGTYDLQVVASDGGLQALDQLQVMIRNSGKAIQNPIASATETRPGDPVIVTAKVTKAGAKVIAVVYRDGAFVGNVTMHDDGDREKSGDQAAGDGIYSAKIHYQDGGDYSVDIVTRYEENGQEQEAVVSDAVTFSVKYTAADMFKAYSGLWIALAALAVAAVGVGGFALAKKWRKP